MEKAVRHRKRVEGSLEKGATILLKVLNPFLENIVTGI